MSQRRCHCAAQRFPRGTLRRSSLDHTIRAWQTLESDLAYPIHYLAQGLHGFDPDPNPECEPLWWSGNRLNRMELDASGREWSRLHPIRRAEQLLQLKLLRHDTPHTYVLTNDGAEVLSRLITSFGPGITSDYTTPWDDAEPPADALQPAHNGETTSLTRTQHFDRRGFLEKTPVHEHSRRQEG